MSGDQFWFESDTNELPLYLTATVRDLTTRQALKFEADKQYFRSYSNQDLNGLDLYDSALAASFRGLALNITQSITDTIVSKIGKNKPKVTFLTDEGDWELKQRAEDLETFVYGQFYKSGAYEMGPRVLKRACVFGDGFSKVYSIGSEIKIDLASNLEILVDNREAMYGDPQTLYQVKFVGTHLLKSLYPKYAGYIEEASGSDFSRSLMVNDYNSPQGMLPVIEAWRLPTRKGAKDGRHVICIDNMALLDETWERNYFPFPHLRFTEKLFGFWGMGVSEIVSGIQTELNKTIKRISRSIDVASVPRVALEYSSKVVKDHITNEIGSTFYYRKTPPIFFAAQAVGAEVFNHLDRLYQKGYELVGMSQLSAGSILPSGLKSSPSIREFHDVETERFSTLQACYDDLYFQTARMMIDEAKEISKKDPNFAIMAKTQEGTKRIKWSDVFIDDDAYIMQMYATNLLPQQPSARTDKVVEYIQGGIFNRDEGISLLDFPDTKAITKLKTAKIDDIMLTINRMMKKGEYTEPQPYQDLKAGKDYCQSFHLLYKNQNAPQERLDLLLKWILDAESLERSLMEEEMQKQAALAPTPIANPTVSAGPQNPQLQNGLTMPNQALPTQTLGQMQTR